MKFIKNLPNLLTLFNLFLGCMAIIYIFNNHMVVHQVQYSDHSETFNVEMGDLDFAAYCIFLAAIIDFFDGFVARLLKVESQLGKELDSLADMVTFGLAPGVILYELFSFSYEANNRAFEYPILFFSAGFAVTIFAALRLARFNLDEEQKTEFRGLPTPAMALLVASLPLLIIRNEGGIQHFIVNGWTLFILTAALCFLMVSEIPMMSLKFSFAGTSKKSWQITLVLLCMLTTLLGIAVFHWLFLVIPVIVILYIVLSIIKNIAEHGI